MNEEGKFAYSVIGTIVVLLVFGVLVVLLSGCSHNTVSYGDGIMLETTINPESYAFGISFRYGKILTACVRENTELEMQGAGSGNAGTGDEAGNSVGATSTGSVKLKIGKQITGYYVDALKAGAKPEQLDEHSEEKPKTPNDEQSSLKTKDSGKTGNNETEAKPDLSEEEQTKQSVVLTE